VDHRSVKEESTALDLPLAGLSCVELNERGAASYAGKLLHRLGAEVTKVESEEGDPLRRFRSRCHEAEGRTTTAAFDYLNEGKKAEVARGHAQLQELLAGADGFVLDLEPRRYASWGLDPTTLEHLPCRVVVAVTAFGLTGPYRDYAGTELTSSAFGGMSVGIGEPGREPLQLPLMQSAIQGGVLAASVLLATLLDLPRGGRAVVIDLSETDIWATLHAGTTMVSFIFSNRMRRRAGRRLLGQPYPHQLFRCKDGWIAVQASERHQYDAFIEMIGSPDWALEGWFGSRLTMNFKHADEIDALVAPWFMARTRAEVFAECQRRKIAAAPVRSVLEVTADEQMRADHRLESYTGATGVEITVPAPPFRFRFADVRAPGRVPRSRAQEDGVGG
jgi:crotonobetainyl-CoA:carnitine CoA-transferase CaiB-like acyl-CoA transferase